MRRKLTAALIVLVLLTARLGYSLPKPRCLKHAASAIHAIYTLAGVDRLLNWHDVEHGERQVRKALKRRTLAHTLVPVVSPPDLSVQHIVYPVIESDESATSPIAAHPSAPLNRLL